VQSECRARHLLPPFMHLIHILLPMKDNKGKPIGRKLFRSAAKELAEKFGGLTAPATIRPRVWGRRARPGPTSTRS
jgi:hypothetical protein